jgi:Protein of unknown function (DUF3616)
MINYEADPTFWQRFLKGAGFYDDKIDGDFGDNSHKAAAAFEAESQRIAQNSTVFDMRSEGNIQTLQPKAQEISTNTLMKHYSFFKLCCAVVAFLIPCLVSSGAEYSLSAATKYPGALDGSAAVSSGTNYFVGATDENNVLRLYSADGGAEPKELLMPDFGFPPSHSGKVREYDVEGAALIGDLIYWIGSHGRNSEGEVRKERQVLFATKKSGTGESTTLELIGGGPYKTLLKDIQAHPALAELKDKLGDAIGTEKADPKKAPKEPGALNIEAICADGDRLLIGFRNPLINSKALIIPLLNPEEVVRGKKAAEFGKPILLDLHGLGIRDMARWGDGFLIIGGDFKDRFDSDAKPSHLFVWKGGEQDKAEDLKVNFGDLNPEAIVVFGEGADAKVLLLSDDGKMPLNGKLNEEQPPAEQFFRGVWLQVAGKMENSASSQKATNDWHKVGDGILMGISGIALVEHQDGQTTFLVVHDNKHEGNRAGLVKIKAGAEPIYEPVAWDNVMDAEKLPKDLEALAAVPGQERTYIAATSAGNLSKIVLDLKNHKITVLKSFDLPNAAPGSEFEGFDLHKIGGKVLAAWASRGDGEKPAILYWSNLDLSDSSFSKPQLIPVEVPWANQTDRDISDLKIDSNGTVFAASAFDGGDDGPFRSVFYIAGAFDASDAEIKFTRNATPVRLHRAEGYKIEALELVPGKDGGVVFATDDENRGSSLYLSW